MTTPTPRAPFMPLDVDVDVDDKLERLAQSKGVGAMVKPVPATAPPEATPQRQGEGARGQPIAPATSRPVEAGAGEGPTPRTRMKSVNLEIPDYVWTDLKIRAAKEAVSVRHILMTALKAHGVTIADADMIEDGRRLR